MRRLGTLVKEEHWLRLRRDFSGMIEQIYEDSGEKMPTLSACKNLRIIILSIGEMKNIPICDLFHMVALDTAGPLLEIKDGNKYVLITIDDYAKWCEVRRVKDHDVATTARFMGKEIICRFGVPIFILTNNGGEWMAEFDLMCKKYGITH
jgi:hypothetical protein